MSCAITRSHVKVTCVAGKLILVLRVYVCLELDDTIQEISITGFLLSRSPFTSALHIFPCNLSSTERSVQVLIFG